MNLPTHIDWGHPDLDAAAGVFLLHRAIGIDALERSAGALLCYLATPYTERSTFGDGSFYAAGAVIAARQAAYWAARLAVRGVRVVSPIIQAQAMVDVAGPSYLDPLDTVFWERWCAPLLGVCDAVIVPPIAGWQASAGIWHEVRETLAFQRPVFLMEADR